MREVHEIERRLAARLAELRAARGWSLDDLAAKTAISRSTLSRIERNEISPTAGLLGRLGVAYERTTSQLLAEVEAESPELLRAGDQPVWRDESTGFTRRMVSPPQAGLRAELVEARLAPGADIRYDEPAVPGLEQHLWMLDGTLELTIGSTKHVLRTGDCLRFRLWDRTHFHNPGVLSARYALTLVRP
ncbi:helix-turn-helix domain-containing protein [Kribbella deserti]|uniref:Helix-turn-helix domain-containing protein n=1 Tax=Kribbella deserti TaxID=1926257 RepID=A0ABV6QJY9_9ACTN